MSLKFIGKLKKSENKKRYFGFRMNNLQDNNIVEAYEPLSF
jgi:hypothetical protein